jgi:hypothetical protein
VTGGVFERGIRTERGMFFWKKPEKWHEVRWFNGPRDIYLAIQFAEEGAPPRKPQIERLSSKDPEANAAQPPLDDGKIVGEIESAVAEYNRKNRFSLRVSRIRFRSKGGADVPDHGAAARKLLNLLWKREAS